MSDLLPILQTILARLDAIESKIGGSEGERKAEAVADVPRSIKGFDAYTASFLDPFVDACNKLGPDFD
jgi:hypothetical protein